MTITDTTSFTLSQEEVYFLLSQVRTHGLLGLNPAPHTAVDADQQRAVLAAAARALQARSMIVVDDNGEPLLDAAVRAAIHAAAFAPRSLTALGRSSDASRLRTYIVHHAEPLWVEHTQPAPGLHEFALSPAPPGVQNRIEQLIGLTDQLPPLATAFTISQAELDLITAAAGSEIQAFQDAIATAGADAATTLLFAELLAGPRDTALIQAIDRCGADEQTKTVTVMSNQHGFWIMHTTDPDTLLCQPAGAAEVRRAVADLVDQL